MLFWGAVHVGLYLVVIAFVRRGANWARILGTVLGCASLLIFALVVLGDTEAPLVEGIMSMITATLTAVTLYFLCGRENRDWFTPRPLPRY